MRQPIDPIIMIRPRSDWCHIERSTMTPFVTFIVCFILIIAFVARKMEVSVSNSWCARRDRAFWQRTIKQLTSFPSFLSGCVYLVGILYRVTEGRSIEAIVMVRFPNRGACALHSSLVKSNTGPDIDKRCMCCIVVPIILTIWIRSPNN